MASKRSNTERGSHQAPKVKILIELSQRAKHEVEKLLARSEAGNITKVELSTGLEELETPLKQMLDYIKGTLDDTSRLTALGQAKTIDTSKLNTGLKEVRKRVKLMLNHGNGDHP